MYTGHAHQHAQKTGATVLNVPPTLSMTHSQMPPGMASMGQRTPNLSYRASHASQGPPQSTTIQQPIPHPHQPLPMSACHASTNCNIKISVATEPGGCLEDLRAPKVTLLDDLSDDVNSSTDDCGDCCLVEDSDTYEAAANNGLCGKRNGDSVAIDGLEDDGEGSGVGGDSGDSMGGIYMGPTH
ncbi:GL25637 [Drosophila persimilis]|uniref:GL25637 n=2 Tax=Drosophila persimilis TaxID=7234 RepID=B4GKR7_DROPE|nr:GL25637 [Drosophila persimilis]